MDHNDNDVEPYANEREKAQWGWNWLEQWMLSTLQPHHAHQMGHNETSYMTLPTTANTATTDEMSEKTVEMDITAHLGSSNMGLPNRDSIESSPYPIKQRQLSSNYGPSYMAPTQFAKAKVRSQGIVKQRGPYGPQWNPSTRKGLVVESGCDSSSTQVEEQPIMHQGAQAQGIMGLA